MTTRACLVRCCAFGVVVVVSYAWVAQNGLSGRQDIPGDHDIEKLNEEATRLQTDIHQTQDEEARARLELKLADILHSLWFHHRRLSEHSMGDDLPQAEMAEHKKKGEDFSRQALAVAIQASQSSANANVAAEALYDVSEFQEDAGDYKSSLAACQSLLLHHPHAELSRVVSKRPQVVLYQHMAGLYAKLGDRRLAVESYVNALLFAPTNEYRNPLESLLRYDPRVVLERYQKRLPAPLRDVLAKASQESGLVVVLAAPAEQVKSTNRIRISYAVENRPKADIDNYALQFGAWPINDSGNLEGGQNSDLTSTRQGGRKALRFQAGRKAAGHFLLEGLPAGRYLIVAEITHANTVMQAPALSIPFSVWCKPLEIEVR